MKDKLFNYEVIALVIASCLVSLGAMTLVQVFILPLENHLRMIWERCGFSALGLGLVSGSIFWLIRRAINKQ
jgi:hypothetical protein